MTLPHRQIEAKSVQIRDDGGQMGWLIQFKERIIPLSRFRYKLLSSKVPPFS